jgi:hypothetical protein
MTYTAHSKRGENARIAEYVPLKTILKEMAAKIVLVKPECIFRPSPGTFR